MSFSTIPVNGWPQLKELDKIAKKVENMPTYTSSDKQFIEDLIEQQAAALGYDNTTSGLTADKVQGAIDEVVTSFQAGVDSVYDACVAKGSTPASHSLSDIITAIGAIATGGYALGDKSLFGRVNTALKLYANTGHSFLFVQYFSSSDSSGSPQVTAVTNGSFDLVGNVGRGDVLPSSIAALYLLTKSDDTLDMDVTLNSGAYLSMYVPFKSAPTLGTMVKVDAVDTTDPDNLSFDLDFDGKQYAMLVILARTTAAPNILNGAFRYADIDKPNYLAAWCVAAGNNNINAQVICVENDGSDTAAVTLYGTSMAILSYAYIPFNL